MRRTWYWVAACVLCATPLQAQDWNKVARLKPGTLIEVRNRRSQFGPEDRCRVIDLDATALRCMWDGDGTTRLIFPLDRVEAVYQVRNAGLGAPPWVALGGLGLMIAGGVTANAGLFAIGLIAASVALNQTIGRDVGPPREKLSVVYRR